MLPQVRETPADPGPTIGAEVVEGIVGSIRMLEVAEEVGGCYVFIPSSSLIFAFAFVYLICLCTCCHLSDVE